MPIKRKKKNAYTNKKYRDSSIASSAFNPKRILSWSQKKANSFRWVEDWVDFYDAASGPSDDKTIEKYKLNYDLYNGRAKTHNYSNMCSSEELTEMGIGMDADLSNIRHHPIIDNIAKAIVGEQKKRPLQPIAIDTSREAFNNRRRKKLELLQGYLKNKIIAPIQERITQGYMQEYGIQDPYSLSPEEQKEMQQQIQQRVQFETPEEIHDFMQKNYRVPSEIQGQKIIDYVIKEQDVKFKTDEMFKHAVITGRELYHVDIRHGNPYLEMVNPCGFEYGASDDSLFVEDGEWARYERIIKYSDIFNMYGDILTASDVKKLDKMCILGGGNNRDRKQKVESNLVSVVSNMRERGSEIDIDIKSREGQEKIKSLMNNGGYRSTVEGYDEIRHLHVVYKGVRKLKDITRINKETQEKEHFIVDESYEFSKLKGDIKENIIYAPEIYGGTKIGYGSNSDGDGGALYLKKGPLPYQYRSLSNPFDVKLPYYGAEYNKLMNNSENVSIMDLGKPWQYRYNVEMARLDEALASDIGNVLLTTMNAKPRDWSWKKFYEFIKYAKIAPLDLHQEGIGPFDAQFFKSVDLSNMSKIAERVQFLEYLKSQIAVSMSYNPSRLGQPNPHEAVHNNQQNIVQSSFQTEEIFSMHNKVVENVLNGLLGAARIAYKDNPVKTSYILDDMSIAELEIDSELAWRSELGIFIRNSSQDHHNMNIAKELLQPMIQNQLINFPDAIRLLWSKTGAEVMNIAEKGQENMEKRQQAQAESQEKAMQQQMQMQMQMEEFKHKLDMMAQDKDIAQKDRAAALDAYKFANQYDIDKNQINDGIEKEREKYQHEKEENEKDRKHQKELERIKAKNKPKASK